MYDYQRIASSRQFGGARAVYTGIVHGISVGKFKVLDLTTLPDAANGCIPAGTPIKMDDAKRTVDVHYAFSVVETVNYLQGATSMSIKVSKSFEGSRARVGMILAAAPSTPTGECAIPLTITAINRTNSAYDTITVSCAAMAGNGSVSAGTVLVEVSLNTDDNKYYIKVLPNALSLYDVVKLPNAVELTIDGIFTQVDGVVLTRRIPPIAPCIVDYLREDGNTYFRYSNAKE